MEQDSRSPEETTEAEASPPQESTPSPPPEPPPGVTGEPPAVPPSAASAEPALPAEPEPALPAEPEPALPAEPKPPETPYQQPYYPGQPVPPPGQPVPPPGQPVPPPGQPPLAPSPQWTAQQPGTAPGGYIPGLDQVSAGPPVAPVPEEPAGTGRGRRFAGVVLIVLGVIFLAQYYIPSFDVVVLVAIALIVLGAWLLLRGRRR